MTLHVNDGGAWKEPKPYVNDGGTWKPVQEAWVKDAGTWKRSYSYFSADASPSSLNASAGTSTITSGNATATPIGGTGPYTYAWTLINQGGDVAVSALSPTSATTAFRATGLTTPAMTGSCDAYCTVTDAASNVTVTGTVIILLTRT